MSARTGKERERFAVLLLPREPGAEPGSPPDVGAPAAWLESPVGRVWVLRYAATQPGMALPQAKQVRSVLRDWAAEHGFRPVRIKVLLSLDEPEIVRLLRVWDQRRGAIGSDVTLAYPLGLPAEALNGAGETVLVYERLRWLFSGLLPWMNSRLQDLHREDVLAMAPTWKKPVWKHGQLGAPPEFAPSRLGRCALESVGRVVASQAERRRAYLALRGAFDPGPKSAAAGLAVPTPGGNHALAGTPAVGTLEMASALEQGQYYPVVLQAESAWDERTAGPFPSRGLVLGVAEQWAKDHQRRRSPEREAWDEFCGSAPPGPGAQTNTELQPPP